MGYKNENIKHRQGIEAEPKYKCPHCGHPFKGLNKIPFMIGCSKCKKVIKGEEIKALVLLVILLLTSCVKPDPVCECETTNRIVYTYVKTNKIRSVSTDRTYYTYDCKEDTSNTWIYQREEQNGQFIKTYQTLINCNTL